MPSNPRRPVGPSRAWPQYYEATANAPARETLTIALERFASAPRLGRRRFAVDLGCGGGADTRELLAHGWRVLAIDAEPAAIERTKKMASAPPLLQTRVANFADAQWPKVDLVNASFALPFCPPDAFSGMWTRIVESIRVGGRFAGHLFGDHDDWATDPSLSVHTGGDVLRLFSGFELELLREQDEVGKTALGLTKHWHVFHVVGCKLGPSSSCGPAR